MRRGWKFAAVLVFAAATARAQEQPVDKPATPAPPAQQTPVNPPADTPPPPPAAAPVPQPQPARRDLQPYAPISSGSARMGMRSDVPPYRPVTINVGLGFAVPVGRTARNYETGGGFQLGVAYNLSRRLGIQLEYAWNRMTLEPDALSSGDLAGYHTLQYGDANAVFNVYQSPSVGLYLIGGPGLYYRRVTVTQFAGVGLVPYCDPWLLVCYGEPVSLERVVGSRSRTDFGLDAGLGVLINPEHSDVRLYAEARYHHVFGPSVRTPEGTTEQANGDYLPIVLGVRF